MASIPRPTPSAPTAETPVELGTFITTIPIGYVEPSPATIARMQEQLRSMTQAVPQSLLRDLLVIKLLMPKESKDLIICNMPLAAQLISKLKKDLVIKYYMR